MSFLYGGKGKGKGRRRQGHGKNALGYVWNAPEWEGGFPKGKGNTRKWQEEGWQPTSKGQAMQADDGEKADNASRRILGRNNLSKAILRPYADEHGSFLYARGSDKEFLTRQSLRSGVSPDVSELDRRPAYGLRLVHDGHIPGHLGKCYYT